MPPQRGQSSRQSPACRFDVGGGRSWQLPCPRLTRLGAGSPLAPQALSTFRNSFSAAQAAGTSSSSGARWPVERRRARVRGGSEAGDIGGDTAGLLLEGTVSPEPRWRPCHNPPVCLEPGFLFSHQRRRRSGNAEKSRFFPRNVKTGEQTRLPLSVILGRVRDRRRGNCALKRYRDARERRGAQRLVRRPALPQSAAGGTRGSRTRRRPLRRPGLRGLFKPFCCRNFKSSPGKAAIESRIAARSAKALDSPPLAEEKVITASN